MIESVRTNEDDGPGIADVDYVPWPEAGCSLGEAQQRVVDRAPCKDRDQFAALQKNAPELAATERGPENRALGRSDNQTCGLTRAPGAVEAEIESEFRSYLANRRLVAYGRPGEADAPAQIIGSGLWQAISRIGWEQSSAHVARPERRSFFDVRVFPVLHAPCRLDLIAGCSLAEVFKRFVLEDPEVAALAKEAIRLAPEFERVFVYGRCYVHGVDEWPMSADFNSIVGTVHPNPSKRWIYSASRRPDPIEAIIAAEALKDRLGALIGLLRSGALEAQGLPTTPGHPLTILRPVWSHRDFSFNAEGDVFQLNYECVDPPIDRLTRRWSAVVLQRGQTLDVGIHFGSEGEHKVRKANDPADALPLEGTTRISAGDLVKAGTLANALTKLIFRHPQVLAVCARAADAAKAAQVLFVEDAGLIAPVYGHDEPLIPLRFFRRDKSDFEAGEASASRQVGSSVWDAILEPLPQDIIDCYGVINARASGVFELLQTREVVGWGHTADGHLVEIARTIWSHTSFYIHPSTGDIYEAGPGVMRRRWAGVVLMAPDGGSKSMQFHMKPIPSDQIRPTTAQSPFGLLKPETEGKAITSAKARKSSREACLAWLEGLMRASPTQRQRTKLRLWEEAQGKWPGTLSERAFIAAWGEAINRSGAIAWSAAGAPRKLK